MFMSECRSNVKQCRPLSDCSTDLGVHYLLRYISVPIFEVNTVSYFAARVTNTTIYLLKYIVLIQNSVAPGQLYASLGISSSPLLRKKSMWPHLPKKLDR